MTRHDMRLSRLLSMARYISKLGKQRDSIFWRPDRRQERRDQTHIRTLKVAQSMVIRRLNAVLDRSDA